MGDWPSPPGPIVPLVRLSMPIGGGLNSFWVPRSTGAWVADSPSVDLTGIAEYPTLFEIVAADLAVAGKTTKLRTRLTVYTNAVAPGVDVRARIFTATFAGASGALTVTGSTEVDSAAITTPGASAKSTAVSAGIALPSDGFYLGEFFFSGLSAAGSRILVRIEVDAYYV